MNRPSRSVVRAFGAVVFAVTLLVLPSQVVGAAPTSTYASWRHALPRLDLFEGVSVYGSSVFVVGEAQRPLGGAPITGPADAFVQRYDLRGNLRWTRIIATEGEDTGAAIVANGTGLYVAGETTGSFPGFTNAGESDVFLSHLTLRGKQIWTTQLGSPGDDRLLFGGDDLAAYGGSIYLTGWTDGALAAQASHGGLDSFVSNWSLGGELRWLRQLGTAKGELGTAVALDESGLYLSAASTPYGIDAYGSAQADLYKLVPQSGRVVWHQRLGRRDAQAMPSWISLSPSGIYVLGSAYGLPGESAFSENGFVARYHRGGTLAWAHEFGPPSGDIGEEGLFAGALLARSRVVYAISSTLGTFPGQENVGSFDYVIVRMSSQGDLLGVDEFGTAGRDWPQAAAGARGIFIVGRQKAAGVLMRIGPERLHA